MCSTSGFFGTLEKTDVANAKQAKNVDSSRIKIFIYFTQILTASTGLYPPT
jgi:hypothetical protein